MSNDTGEWGLKVFKYNNMYKINSNLLLGMVYTYEERKK